MKAIRAILLLLALGLPTYGQAVSVTANKIKGSATAPSGACSAQQVQLTTAGVVYVCASGTWTSSGGGTTINSTNGQVPYRVNSTTFGDSAFASNALNSTYLSATSGASGAGLTLTVAGGGTNENLILAAKGTGSIRSDFNYITSGSTIAYYTYLSSSGLEGISGGTALKANGTQVLGVNFNHNYALVRSDGGFGWSSGSTLTGSPDTGIIRSAAGAMRTTNGSTGAGQLLIGTSTDTADAQLSVYSQNATRPGLKLNMPSGTSTAQEAFGVYNNGTRRAYITTGGMYSAAPALTADADTFAIEATGDYSNRTVIRNTSTGATSALYVDNSAAFSAYGGLSISGSAHAGSFFGTSRANAVALIADGANLSNLLIGTLTSDSIIFGTANAARWTMNASGHLLGGTDNTYDIGASGSNRPKTGYFGTSIVAPTVALTANQSWTSGTGAPSAGACTSSTVGSLYSRTDGGTGTSLYVCEGTTNTWVAK